MFLKILHGKDNRIENSKEPQVLSNDINEINNITDEKELNIKDKQSNNDKMIKKEKQKYISIDPKSSLNVDEWYDPNAHFTAKSENKCNVNNLIKSKVHFEREKENVLGTIDKAVKKDFRILCFCKFGKDILPACQLGPFDVSPGEVRNKWFRMFENVTENGRAPARLVYWYGTPKSNLSDAFSFVPAKSIISYEVGCEKGYDKLSTTLQRKLDSKDKKLSKSDLFKIRGQDEFNVESKLLPEDRVKWIQVNEDHENVDVKYYDIPVELECNTSLRKHKKLSCDDKSVNKKSGRKKKLNNNSLSIYLEEGKVNNVGIEYFYPHKIKIRILKNEKKNEAVIIDAFTDKDFYEQNTKSVTDNDTEGNDFVVLSDSKEEFNNFQTAKKKRKYNDNNLSCIKKIENRKLDMENIPPQKNLHELHRREDKRKLKCTEFSEKFISKSCKTQRRKVIPKEHIVEQRNLEECETVFLPIMRMLNKALQVSAISASKKYIKQLHEQVEIITPSFIREHGLGLLIRKVRKKFEDVDLEVRTLCRDLTNDMKRIYGEKSKVTPKDFKPIVNKSLKSVTTEAVGSRKKPFYLSEIRKSDNFTIMEKNVMGKKMKDSDIYFSDDITTNKKKCLNQPIIKNREIVVLDKHLNVGALEILKPDRNKVTKEKFSLGKLFKKKKIVSVDNTTQKHCKKIVSRVVLPDWLTRNPPNNHSYPDNEDRAFAMDIFEDAVKFISHEKVNPSSIASELEAAIYKWSEKKNRAYWDKVHEIVAAVTGENLKGSILENILEGNYKTPMDVVEQKKTLLSVKGLTYF